MKKENIILFAAHELSSENRDYILSSENCGCFYCLNIFPANNIEEWTDDDENGTGQTALCPKCGIDCVLGDSKMEINEDFLEKMKKWWF